MNETTAGLATAGELAYDAYRKAAQNGIDEYWGWFSLTDQQRGAWEAAAAAVETDQLRLAREDRDQLRKRVLDLAAKFAGQGLGGVAHQLRKIAGPPS